MHKILTLGLVILTAGALMLGCAAPPTVYSDPSKAIEVASGSQFTLALKGNATTGFTWAADYDKTLFSLAEDKYVTDQNPQGMVGVGGTQNFTFKALKAGKGTIACKYARTWESVPPAQTLTFNVTVK
jgi:inhibitor of cysteine peptidase